MPSLHFKKIPLADQFSLATTIQAQGGVLLTEWIAAQVWYVLYLLPEEGLYGVCSTLDADKPMLIDLSEIFPVAQRLQRAMHELWNIPTRRAKDKRLWLNHGHWPLGILNDSTKQKTMHEDPYVFQTVQGQGVHEIPVGPVHAGIIEPGHFRFSVVGERVLKLETRLGYVHKGIAKLIKNKSIESAATLIARVSGDSSVSYSLAFSLSFL